MNVHWRAQAMLADPAAEWAAIAAEPGDAAYVLNRYVTVLALIPAAFSFVGACIVGVVVPIWVRSARRCSTACSARSSATS